jgi:PAS domain S-box-containing protein
MLDWLLRMFDSTGFPDRWHCGEWSTFLGWLHIASDVTIWFAYMGIPAVLFYFVRRRRDLPFLPVFVLFMLFIAFCGFGHLIEAVMFWWPGYRFSGAVKLATAVVSIGTLLAMVPFTRRAIAFPGTANLLAQLRRTSAEHHRSQEALHLTQEQLRMATAASGVGLWDWRLDGDQITWDAYARSVFGLAADDAAGGRDYLLALVHPEDREAVGAALQATVANGTPLDARFRITRRGDIAFVVVRGTAIRGRDGTVIGVTGAFFDVTDEENARRVLQASLRQKDTLLGEIHHRVKNNMQVVTSILSLRAMTVEEGRFRRMLEDCGARVRTMAMIHERLYSTGNYAALDCAAYVRDLAGMLMHSQARDSGEIRLELDLEPLTLDFHSAIPIGLILNEVMTNSLKHAFPAGRSGTVRVSLREVRPGIARLTVADDGVGIADVGGTPPDTGLGYRMLRGLVRQIDGEMQRTAVAGVTVEITFPMVLARNGAAPAAGGRAT